MLTRRSFLQAGAVSGVATLTGCTVARDGEPTTRTTTAGPPLRLGVPEYRPYAFRGEDGPTGQVPEIARAAFGRLGVDVEIELVPYNAVRPGLTGGDLDMIGALRLVDTNCEWVAHYVADHLSHSALAVPAGNPLGLNTFEDVVAKNARLLAIADSLEETAVPNATIAPNAEVALTMLAEGRADCFAYDDITLRYLTARRPELAIGRIFEPPGGSPVYGFGFAPEHGAVADSLRDALAALRKSGEWSRVAEPFGFTEGNVLTAEDVDRTCE